MTNFDKKSFDDSYEDAINDVNEQLEKEILFAMVGDVNTGKSSTINCLMGDEVAPVGSKPGETTNIIKYSYKDKILFADTPGLDDIVAKNSEETLKFQKEADVVLFFLNAAGTVFSEGEKKNFDRLRKVNENIIIVLNKIDAADDVPGLVTYIQQHTEYKHKVVPISSRTGQEIEKLRGAILDILKSKKKDILFGKHLKDKATTANRWIIAAAGSSSAIGLSPIPGSDFVPLTAVQVGLLVKLATLYDKPLSKERAQELTLATITGNIGKSVFRQIVKVIPGAGSIAGASVAGSMTLALGYSVKYAYENNIEVDASTLNSLYNNYFNDKR